VRAHYLQHVPFEGPGSILPWLSRRGADVTSTPFFVDACLPDPADVDFLIVMGGPMSANDEADLPWLAQEKQFIRETIVAGRPVLGICLGAQLIASALGARVYQNPLKEIGWFEIDRSGVAEPGEVILPDRALVFHWHGETFDLPPGATRLASSVGCLNQAFQIGPLVVGLQFHLEVTPESVGEMVAHGRHELVPDRFVQSEAAILEAPPTRYAEANRIMDEVLESMAASLRG
jgi:GMP synthase-like glutamine amidotransferase